MAALPRPARWRTLLTTTPPAQRPRSRELAIAAVAGLFVSVVAGMFGVGGGILLVPVLVLILHREQHVAHATSLVAILFAAVSGGARFAFSDAVAWVPAIIIVVGAVIGAQLGARFLPRMSASVLRTLFAGLLVVVGIRFVVAGSGAATSTTTVPDLEVLVGAAYVGLGLVTGLASAVLGVGGGLILVPALVVLFGFGQHIAEGTSLAVILPTALTGALAHHRSGYTDWTLGVALGIAGLAGGALGAQFALGLEADTLGRAFGVMMLVIAAVMIKRSRPAS